MPPRVFIVLGLLLIAAPHADAATPPEAALRTWSDASGSFTVQARLIKFEGKTVRLLSADGRTIDLSIERLSAIDQSFLRTGTPTPEHSIPPLDFLGSTWSEPVNLGTGVNEHAGEYAPSLTSDELTLVFTSNRRGQAGVGSLYMCRRESTNEQFDAAVDLKFHGVSPCLTADGLGLLFQTGLGTPNGLDLWSATRNSISKPFGDQMSLGSVINGDTNDGGPALSSDGLVLVYCRRPSPSSEPDLWMSRRPNVDARFGAPTRLGSGVNTDASEEAPAISADHLTLFFQSDRPGGHGKFDIWMSRRESEDVPFDTAVNLGPMINSAGNNQEPWISDDAERLYFSSDRPGGQGAVDLWYSRRVPSGSAGRSANAADASRWIWRHDETRRTLALCGEKTIWEFHYTDDLPKPFFHPVALPGGPVLTWNSPPDHPWHHALWFSWKFINGVNYWERDGKTGRPEGRTQWSNVLIRTDKSGMASIDMHLDYRAPDNSIVLTEERSIAISAPDESGRYHFDWTGVFTAVAERVTLDRTPLPDGSDGRAHGGYAGLSVRFAKELAERQAVSNTGPVEFDRQSRYRGKALAVDYNGQIGSQEVGIAICDHPDNPNHPSPWYAIRSTKVSYFSPAVICYAPHILKAGETTTLRYRVVVHPERWGADRLTREFECFIEDEAGNPRAVLDNR